MKSPRPRIWHDLLFLDGHIADPRLALALADEPAPPASPRYHRSTPMSFFKSLMYLGGLEDVNLRINEDGTPYGPTYGNRVASAQAFGKRRLETPAARRERAPAVAFRECAVGGCS